MADSGAVLIGGLVTLGGAALQAGFSILKDNTGWKRQQATRWDENNRRLYVDYLVHLHKAALAISIAAMTFDDQATGLPRREQFVDSFRIERDQVRISYEEIELVARSKAITLHAIQAYEALRGMRELQLQGVHVDEPKWLEAHAALNRERENFRRAVRWELNLPGLPS